MYQSRGSSLFAVSPDQRFGRAAAAPVAATEASVQAAIDRFAKSVQHFGSLSGRRYEASTAADDVDPYEYRRNLVAAEPEPTEEHASIAAAADTQCTIVYRVDVESRMGDFKVQGLEKTYRADFKGTVAGSERAAAMEIQYPSPELQKLIAAKAISPIPEKMSLRSLLINHVQAYRFTVVGVKARKGEPGFGSPEGWVSRVVTAAELEAAIKQNAPVSLFDHTLQPADVVLIETHGPALIPSNWASMHVPLPRIASAPEQMMVEERSPLLAKAVAEDFKGVWPPRVHEHTPVVIISKEIYDKHEAVVRGAANEFFQPIDPAALHLRIEPVGTKSYTGVANPASFLAPNAPPRVRSLGDSAPIHMSFTAELTCRICGSDTCDPAADSVDTGNGGDEDDGY